jgi:hypothetical protein
MPYVARTSSTVTAPVVKKIASVKIPLKRIKYGRMKERLCRCRLLALLSSTDLFHVRLFLLIFEPV